MRQRQRETERARELKRERDRETQRERETERQRERERQPDDSIIHRFPLDLAQLAHPHIHMVTAPVRLLPGTPG